jgi:single-strand DNA-binding protein
MSLAQVTVMGNLGRDPETRYTNSGKMTVKFSVAHSYRVGSEESTDWYNVTAWGKLAETLDKLAQTGALGKGTQVLVIGRQQHRKYTASDGSERYSLDVDANDVQLAGGRASAGPRADDEETLPF